MGIPPQVIQAMMQSSGGQPPAAPSSVLPQPGGPVQQPGSQTDPMMAQLLQSTQQGQQAFGEQLQRTRSLADTIGQLQQQQNQMPVPKTGYQPKFQPMTGQGAGHDIGNAVGNIGKALLLGLSATGPGQDVSSAIYGPGIRQYQAKSGQLAQRIQQLQGQEKIEEEPLGAAAQMGYKPYGAIGSAERGQAALTNASTNAMNAQTKQLAEQHKYTVQTESNRLKGEISKGRLTQEQARTQLMGVIAKERDSTLRDVANIQSDKATAVEQQRAAEQDFKTESDHWLQNLFGESPSKPVQTAAQPKPAARAGKTGGGGRPTHIFTPGQGLKPAGQ
jgi:hypothetical protein